ncbi:hypothetical protein [Paraburkholderia caribensis]|uniref:hypothetical protein n=1 Tax=Paraburkholderia caribensis TaxID=75105 RepID=UPI001F2F7363|nr:hypothetical protein [Paraburkholderia caribensis]
MAIATAESNGGTWSCSLASSLRDVGAQQVAARRQHLAELHENRPEAFQRETQPHAWRLVELPANGGDTQQIRTRRSLMRLSIISSSPKRMTVKKI